MMFPFARRNVGASEEAHPGVGACQSEKQELRTGPVALRQRLDCQHCAPIICKSREKMTAAVRARQAALARWARSGGQELQTWTSAATCLKAWRTVHRSCWSGPAAVARVRRTTARYHPALSLVPVGPQGHEDYPTRDPCALAPRWISPLPALENPTPPEVGRRFMQNCER